MNPLHIEMTRSQRIIRRFIVTLLTLILILMFIAGFVIVYKNSYNMMNDTPMVVFSFYKSDNGISVIILNHRYDFY